jgi:hypothetical protein
MTSTFTAKRVRSSSIPAAHQQPQRTGRPRQLIFSARKDLVSEYLRRYRQTEHQRAPLRIDG